MKNIGSTDKIIRFIIAIVLGIVAYIYMDALGVWMWAVIGVALIAAGTAVINFCPLYAVFGIKTCKID